MSIIKSILDKINIKREKALASSLNNLILAQQFLDLITPTEQKCKTEALKQVKPKFASIFERGSSIKLPKCFNIGDEIKTWDNLHFADKKTRKKTFDLYISLMEKHEYKSMKGQCPRLERQSTLMDCEDKLISELSKYTGVNAKDLKTDTIRKNYLDGCKNVIKNTSTILNVAA